MEQMEQLRHQIVQKQILLDDLTKRAAMLQALYEYEKGMLEIRRMETYYECMALKQKMEIIQSYRKNGRGISDTLLSSMLAAQKNDHSYILQEMKQTAGKARKQLDALQIHPDVYQSCKNLYRKILENCTVPAFCEKARNAYLINDLSVLRALEKQIPSADGKEWPDLSMQLSVLDESIADLMKSDWFANEAMLMDENKTWLQPIMDECEYYEKVKAEMESLIERTGHS